MSKENQPVSVAQPLTPVIQVERSGAVSQTPAAPEAIKPVVAETSKKAIPLTAFQSGIEEYKKSGSDFTVQLIALIEKHLVDMAGPEHSNRLEAANIQYRFWKQIRSILALKDPVEFQTNWGILLAYAHEYRETAFNPKRFFRYSEFWTQSGEELGAFQRIGNLIIRTADAKERQKGLRTVNIELTLGKGFDEVAINNLISFYRR